MDQTAPFRSEVNCYRKAKVGVLHKRVEKIQYAHFLGGPTCCFEDLSTRPKRVLSEMKQFCVCYLYLFKLHILW